MQGGCARVSKQYEQDTAAQLRALERAGAERVFTEHASGGRWDRPELHKMLDQLRAGAVVVVWKLECLARNLDDLRALVNQLTSKGVRVEFIKEVEWIPWTGPQAKSLRPGQQVR